MPETQGFGRDIDLGGEVHHLTWFITPHGFGHAARAVAIMAALQERLPCFFHIRTSLPAWFFAESLGRGFSLNALETDIGLVQRSPLEEDMDATCERLDAFFPFDRRLVGKLAGQLVETGCELVVCDIAPLGIAVAEEAGIDSVLVENFTWDWIYAGYAEKYPRLLPHIDYLAEIFSRAGHHIQTEPVCRPRSGALTSPPVSRKPRTPARVVRQRLGSGDLPMILVTMGGIACRCSFLERLRRRRRYLFLLPGGAEEMTCEDNLRLFPMRSGFYHPDLIAASGAVVGKVGYSTLAEVWQAGVPYGYIPRSNFRESIRLSRFAREEMAAMAVGEAEFESGDWTRKIPALLSLAADNDVRENGADQVASHLVDLLTKKTDGNEPAQGA